MAGRPPYGGVPVPHRRLHPGHADRPHPHLPPRGRRAAGPGVSSLGVQRPGPAGPAPRVSPPALAGGGRRHWPGFSTGRGKSVEFPPGNQDCLYYIAYILRRVVGFARSGQPDSPQRWKAGGGRGPRRPPALPGVQGHGGSRRGRGVPPTRHSPPWARPPCCCREKAAALPTATCAPPLPCTAAPAPPTCSWPAWTWPGPGWRRRERRPMPGPQS